MNEIHKRSHQKTLVKVGSPIAMTNAGEVQNSGTASSGARNVYTQHGKRTKVSQGKLNGVSLGGTNNLSSGKGLSIETSQNLTAKRLGASTEAYNSIAQNINQECGRTASKPSVSGAGILPGLKGPNVQSLLKDQQDEDGKQSVFIEQVAGPHSIINQNVGSNGSLIETEQPSDVAIRVNKINIAIKNGQKAGQVLGTSDQCKASMDSREQMNFSNLTNYHKNSKPQPMFGEDGEHNVKDDKSKESTPQQQNGTRRKFKPVLKSKSYLN